MPWAYRLSLISPGMHEMEQVMALVSLPSPTWPKLRSMELVMEVPNVPKKHVMVLVTVLQKEQLHP